MCKLATGIEQDRFEWYSCASPDDILARAIATMEWERPRAGIDRHRSAD